MHIMLTANHRTWRTNPFSVILCLYYIISYNDYVMALSDIIVI